MGKNLHKRQSWKLERIRCRMILSVDVQYQHFTGFAAGIIFEKWDSQTETECYISKTNNIEEYIPGEFYKRELPCILNVINLVKRDIQCILIDGYVYLDGHSKPGLGKYLFDQLSGKIPVVGIAKSSFGSISDVYKISRGNSSRGLYVTSIGLP